MKTILGLLAMLFGGVGVLLLVTCGVAAWRAEGVVVERTDRAVERASERLVKVEGRLTRLEGRVKELTVDVDFIRTAAGRLALKIVLDVAARTEVDQLHERLDRALAKTEELGETLDVVARLVEDVSDLAAQFDGSADRVEQLRRVAQSLEQAAALLTDVRTVLAEVRTRNAAPDPRKLTDLAERARGPLEQVAGGIDAVRRHSVEARGELEVFRGKVHFWARAVAAVLTFVVVWFGLGQACLVGWGWQRVRRSPQGGTPPRSG